MAALKRASPNNGVGQAWAPFKSDSLVALYSAEAPGPYVESGKTAQRITTAQASLGDRPCRYLPANQRHPG